MEGNLVINILNKIYVIKKYNIYNKIKIEIEK